MTNPKIIEVNYALASTYADFIEINYKLAGPLRKKILDHELKHNSGNSYTKQDFKTDFKSENSYFFESLKFSILNPECLIGFFPFMYSYYAKDWTFNFPAIFPYMWFGLIFSTIVSLMLKMNFFLALLCYTALFALLNILLLIITHINIKKWKGFVYKEVSE